MPNVALDDYNIEVSDTVSRAFQSFLNTSRLSIQQFTMAHGPLAVIVQQPDLTQSNVFSITIATPRNFSSGTLRNRLREILVALEVPSNTLWELTSVFGILWNRELIQFSDFGHWLWERGHRYSWAIQHNNAIRMFDARSAMEIKLRWVNI